MNQRKNGIPDCSFISGQDEIVWTLANGESLGKGRSFGLMGILNLTPDSFYDGGKYQNLEDVLERAAWLLKSGADILDLGGQSTRPGYREIAASEELARVIPVLLRLRRNYPEAIISIDTFNSSVAAIALENGAEIINDVSAFEKDPLLIDILVQYKPAYILTHCIRTGEEKTPDNGHAKIMNGILNFFERKLGKLINAGLPESNIALDPGIGFGKDFFANTEILKKIEMLKTFGRPILAGISMKSFFGDLLGLSIRERGESTAIASALLWQKGVFWHRVHDVAKVKNALFLASALAS